MRKTAVKDNSFITIQAFMVNDLHLSGNELIVYAIIYGFSHDGASWFMGSRSYIANWCQTSEKSVTHNLHKLLDKGLIRKRSESKSGRMYNYYQAVQSKISQGEKVPPTGEESSPGTGEESSLGTGEESSPNTIEGCTSSGYDSSIYCEIIDYLNQKAGKRYRVTKSVKRLISARFRDGYTLDDFKRVIDTKYSDWEGTKYEKYLQPSTLFSDGHFDNYLNERPKKGRNDEYDDFSAYDKSVPVRDSAKLDTSVSDDWEDIKF